MKKITLSILSLVLIGTLSLTAFGQEARKFYRHTTASTTTNINDIVNSFQPGEADLPLLQQEITHLTVKGAANGTNLLIATVSRITKGTTFTVSALTNAVGVSQGRLAFDPSIILGTNDTMRITLTDLTGNTVYTNAIILETLQK